MSRVMQFGIACTMGALLLAGCATASIEQRLAERLGPDAIGALRELQASPLLAAVHEDAAATRAWATSVLGPRGTAPDPVKYQLALACPTATDAVGVMIGQTIEGLVAQIEAMAAPEDPSAPRGRMMLFLTKLKYGSEPNARERLGALQGQLSLQMDALFTGCVHLFPKKQVHDAVKLMKKAGITGFSGGTLGPLMGLLP